MNADLALIMPLRREMSEDESDHETDRELQVAFENKLLRTDRLNILVPKKATKIIKGPELKQRLAELTKKLPWVERLDVTTPSAVNDGVAKDDFQRELAFYKQAEAAVREAVPRLASLGVRVFRPTDYYAEMAKSDVHMQKVRKRLLDIQDQKEKVDTMKRIKEEKRYASKVQQNVLAQRTQEKKKLMEAVKKHKKGMKGQLEAMLSNAKKMQLDEEDDSTPGQRGGETKSAKKAVSRNARDKKFGFGGQKKRGKGNDRTSHDDVSFRPKGSRRNGGGRIGKKGKARR